MFNWNDASEARVLTLHGQGLTAREIAIAMGEGLTRQAIIGKLNRLKIPGHQKNRFAYSMKRAKQPVLAQPQGDSIPKTLLEVSHAECRFPFEGDVFCAQPTDGGPWCPIHKALVFTKPQGAQS